MHKLKTLTILTFLLLVTGCDLEMSQVVRNKPPTPEKPIVNLPQPMRTRNWVSKLPSKMGQGSCVHASTYMLFRWLGEDELAEKWKKRYSGGETASSILKYWNEAGLPYCSTFNSRTYECSGDPAFLQWCSDTRRGAIIWWKTSHCCLFCGFEEINGKQYAIILDNNTPDKYDEPIPADEFIRRWRGFGGFAATPILTPTGPLPWPIIVPRSYKEN
mgnify:CR=1 FL=1